MVQGLQTLSYNERLKKLELPSLEFRRRRGTMIEMFKIGYNRYDPKATKDMFELNKGDTRTNNKRSDNEGQLLQMANLLNYKFSTLGCFYEKKFKNQAKSTEFYMQNSKY